MPIERLKGLNSKHEPKRKNPITLGDDSFIGSHLKPFKIDSKNSILELSDSELKVRGTITSKEANLDKIIAGGGLAVDTKGQGLTILNGSLSSFELDSYNTRIRIYDDTSTSDHLTISVAADGASTIATQDNDGSNGSLTLASNGNILLAPSTGAIRFYDSDNSADYVDFQVNANGALTIGTNDTAGTDANILLDADGDIFLEPSSGGIKLKESADASADSSSFGQVWVHDTTPNELCFTDDAGTDIVGIGKYHYETKFIGYYATATTVYFPMTGYIYERTSTASSNEYIGFVAPYNGTLEKFAFRSEIAHSATCRFVVLESADNTETPGSAIHRFDEALSIADDTYHEYDLSSPSIGTAYGPMTKGRIYAFEFTTGAASFDTNITLVFKWDITS